MRLKRIELYDDFRSLHNGFTLNFIESEQSYKGNDAIEPYCVVGRNGSGKSNILELLSAIFYQLEVSCLDFLPKEKIIKFNEDDEDYEDYEELGIYQSFKTAPNAYKLEYYITLNDEEVLVTIYKEADKYRNIYLGNDFENPIGKKELQNKERPILPEHIIGYSSGQNEILSLPFFKMRLIQYDEYLGYLKRDENFANHESRMIYLDDAFSQAIFISNFIFTDDIVNEVFRDTIGVESVESFRIVINLDTKGIIEEEEKLLKNNVVEKINLLKSCSTMCYEDIKNKQLILDYYLDDVVKDAFRLQFGEKNQFGKEMGQLNLFRTFQTLINLNYYHIDEKTKNKLYNSDSLYAKGYLPQAPWNERFFGFKQFMLKKEGIDDIVLSRSLSDGEYQFLHSIGLTLIYRNTQSLFLLDEPETHFNPSWRAEYMSVLKKCFEDVSVKAEFLITSHSPFIVSDTKEENVILFEKDENNIINRKETPLNTFGASVNEITDVIFNNKASIGNLSLKELNDSIKNVNTIEDYNKAKIRLNRLGDSIEKFDAYNHLNKIKKEFK